MADRPPAAKFLWRTCLPQFSLRTLLVWMAIAAMAMIGLANASRLGAQVAVAAVLVAAGMSILAVCFGEADERQRGVGRLVFGGLFFVWAVGHLDQLVTRNGMAGPGIGSITESVNDWMFQGISRLQNGGQRQTIQFLASPYLSPSNVPGAVNTAYYDPVIASGGPFSPGVTYPQLLVPSLATQNTFVTAPTAISGLVEFRTIADCFWTLVIGTGGGWLAMLVYRRPGVRPEESDRERGE